MIINHNLSAMNAQRQMGANQANGAKAQEKLSSGLRINRAGDDAAGLAISEKMRAQVRGLDQASRNAQDGISLIQTAEGALNETQSILQRMRELATQSSNGTNTDADRSNIQDEINQLKEEIDRIGNNTEFNTKKLVDGSVGAKKLPGVDNAAVVGKAVGEASAATLTTNTIATGVGPASGVAAFTGSSATFVIDGAQIEAKTAAADYTKFANGTNVDTAGLAKQLETDINKAIDEYNTAYDKKIDHISVSSSGPTNGNLTFKSGSTGGASTISISSGTSATTNFAENVLGITAGNTSTGTDGLEGVYSPGGAGAVKAINGLTGDAAKTTFTVDGKDIEVNFAAADITALKAAANDAAANVSLDDVRAGLETDLNKAIENYNKTVPTSEQVKDVTVSIKDGSFVVQSGSDKATSSVKFDNSQASQLLGLSGQNSATQGGGVSFQIGANQGQNIKVTVEDMRADALKVADVDVSTVEGAEEGITKINDAIEAVSKQRSSLGAVQNRLEHTISNLDNSSENLQAAESRIRDVDMAKEIMEFTKNNILSQASQSMLAQANQAPQQVLQLLG